jgi:hypothetical protein
MLLEALVVGTIGGAYAAAEKYNKKRVLMAENIFFRLSFAGQYRGQYEKEHEEHLMRLKYLTPLAKKYRDKFVKYVKVASNAEKLRDDFIELTEKGDRKRDLTDDERSYLKEKIIEAFGEI